MLFPQSIEDKSKLVSSLFPNLKKLDFGLEERQHVIVLKGQKAKDVLDYKDDLKSTIYFVKKAFFVSISNSALLKLVVMEAATFAITNKKFGIYKECLPDYIIHIIKNMQI
jgi:hypothetical protein